MEPEQYPPLDWNIMEAQQKHEILRQILIDNNCPEVGDAIIDEISTLFGYRTTTNCIYDHNHNDGQCVVLES